MKKKTLSDTFSIHDLFIYFINGLFQEADKRADCKGTFQIYSTNSHCGEDISGIKSNQCSI
jgi:hypothetical protein